MDAKVKKKKSPGLHASVCRTADSAMEADYSGLCQQFVSVQSVSDNHNAAMFVTHLYYIVISHSLKNAGLAPMETVNCLEMNGVCVSCDGLVTCQRLYWLPGGKPPAEP